MKTAPEIYKTSRTEMGFLLGKTLAEKVRTERPFLSGQPSIRENGRHRVASLSWFL